MRFNLHRTLVPLILTVVSALGQVRRHRNEGTFNIPASNVIGHGNIVIAPSFGGSVSQSGIRFDPGASLAVGITDMLQLTGKTALAGFRKLGGTEARLQLTTPRNDHLRFFGVSLSGDLYLSTEMDTLSGNAVRGRPEYHAYIRPSLIVDLDWIARFRKLPLKTYLLLNMADNPDLLYLYSQISIRFGTEWKLSRNSYSLDIGAGFYRELQREREVSPGGGGYDQLHLWMEPSIRYRFFDRISLLGAARILLLQKVKRENGLSPTYVRISSALEIPILFKETNAEAIRTLIFVENAESDRPDSISMSINDGVRLEPEKELRIEGVDINITDEESEKEVLRRREEIQAKMEEIERLLEEIE